MLLEPGWAPFSVIALHLVFAEYGLTERFDHLLHFLGGAAITYFLYQVMKLGSFLPDGYRWMNYVCAFTTGCTVAVFWEFAEFASDVFRQTSVQQSLQETMLDLVFGVLGAIAALLVVSAVCLVRGNRKVL